MTNAPLPTKDRLIHAAATLFRTRGYHGVGLADVLADAKAPKGSLYHHFPNGKSDLALAAATWASTTGTDENTGGRFGGVSMTDRTYSCSAIPPRPSST